MMNPELIEYAELHSTPELPILAKLNRETHLTQVYPRMLAGHIQGTLLRFISSMMKPRRILEIGTFTGYSAINLALGLNHPTPSPSPEGEGSTIPVPLVHTIEVDPEQEEIIRRYIHKAGVDQQIVLHIGNAMDIIPGLNEIWDLVYIDADKPNYLNYYKMVFDNLRPGGFFLADNTLWNGKVLKDRSKMNRDTSGIVAFNEFVQHDERVENMILPFRDGIMMIRKL